MLDQLFNFCKVLEIGNLTKAARELGITQPALSISIKNLEKQLGCKLMTRDRTGIRPTKLGEIVYKHSKSIELKFRNLRLILDEKNRKLVKCIRIGMIDSVAQVFADKVYKDFIKKHPKTNLNVYVDNSYGLIERVEKGSIDLAIITKGDKKLSKKFVQRSFGKEEMALVASPKIFKTIKNVKSLNKMNFISYNKESTTHKMIKKALEKEKIHVNYFSFSSSPEYISKITRNSAGIAFLSKGFVQNDLLTEDLKKVRIANFRFFRKFQLIYLKTTFLPGITLELIKKLKKIL